MAGRGTATTPESTTSVRTIFFTIAHLQIEGPARTPAVHPPCLRLPEWPEARRTTGAFPFGEHVRWRGYRRGAAPPNPRGHDAAGTAADSPPPPSRPEAPHE